MPSAGSDLAAPTAGVVRRAVTYCTAVYLVARIVLSLLGLASVDDATISYSPAGFPALAQEFELQPGIHNLFDATVRWDARWFVRIASTGYEPTDGSAEFYPAFPLAARVTAWATPFGPTGASILVANLAFLAALIVLYLLSALEFTETVARRTTVLLAVYPASFVLMAPLSESTYLLATVTTFYLARRGHWAAGSVAGIIATATRAVGIWLIPSLMIEAWSTSDPRLRRRRLVASIVPGFGLAAYLGYWWVRAGDPVIPLEAPALWGRTVEFPLLMLGRAVALGITGPISAGGWVLTVELVATAVLIVPLALWWRTLRPAYAVYAALTFLLLLTVGYPPRPLAGAPRYLCVVFPLFWLLAVRLEGRAYVAAASLFGATWVVLAVAFIGGEIYTV